MPGVKRSSRGRNKRSSKGRRGLHRSRRFNNYERRFRATEVSTDTSTDLKTPEEDDKLTLIFNMLFEQINTILNKCGEGSVPMRTLQPATFILHVAKMLKVSQEEVRNAVRAVNISKYDERERLRGTMAGGKEKVTKLFLDLLKALIAAWIHETTYSIPTRSPSTSTDKPEALSSNVEIQQHDYIIHTIVVLFVLSHLLWIREQREHKVSQYVLSGVEYAIYALTFMRLSTALERMTSLQLSSQMTNTAWFFLREPFINAIKSVVVAQHRPGTKAGALQ